MRAFQVSGLGQLSIQLAMRVSKPKRNDRIGFTFFSIIVQLSQFSSSLFQRSIQRATWSQPKVTIQSMDSVQLLLRIMVHQLVISTVLWRVFAIANYYQSSPQLTKQRDSLLGVNWAEVRQFWRSWLLGRTKVCPKMRVRVEQQAITTMKQNTPFQMQTALGLFSARSDILNRCFQISIQQYQNQMSYNSYQIPPDFNITTLHQDAALPLNEYSNILDRCPCCQRSVGDQSIPICIPTAKLINIGAQIPLYFMYIRLVALAMLVYAVMLVIQYFSSNIQEVDFVLELSADLTYTVTIGYVQKQRWVRFIFFIIFTFLILVVRAFLKKLKYQVQNMSSTLSDKSVMLTNVNRKATTRDISKRFEDWDIEKIVFTYRVRQYHLKLVQIYQIQKEKIIAINNGESKLRVDMIQHRLDDVVGKAEDVASTFRKPQNQLDLVFLTFRTPSQRDVFLAKYRTNILTRLFYKFCTCCSPTSIQGQHITVVKAPQPQDIDWLNLQYKYWTKKIHRISCYYMCFSILIYGIMFQYQISIIQSSNFTISIIRTIVVFVVNFLIITLLEYTTFEVQKHQLNTNKILSLVRKLTFFIFLNLSMSPLAIYLYQEFWREEGQINANTTAFDDLVFAVLTICIGNVFKPLAEYFNAGRMLKSIGMTMQKRKRDKCQMTQEEANLAFQPIPFPLASFYSLIISSILMTAFFLSCFQMLIILEIAACGVLFFISKYMLLKVCKEPTGLLNHVGRLSQRLITTSIYIYWFGDKVMYYCILEKNQQDFGEYILDFGAFGIIELIILVAIFLFSSKLLSKIMKRFAEDEELSTSLIKDANRQTNKINSYQDVNAIKKVEEEYKKILKAT